MTMIITTTESRKGSRRKIKKRGERGEREASLLLTLHNPTVYNYPHILSRRPSGGLQGATSFKRGNFSKLKHGFEEATIQNAKTFFFSKREKEGLPK